jgi:hypothetical protein
MAPVYPLDGVTYYISELFVGTGTGGSSTGGQRRRGLGGHIVFWMRGNGYVELVTQLILSTQASEVARVWLLICTLSNRPRYGPDERYFIYNFHAVPLREGYI